jgi:predicted RNase H-like nuclease (RuvC/YqgF family)
MASTSLNEIYRAIGALTEAVEGLKDQIGANEKRNEEAIRSANESRANVHRRLDALVERTTDLETSMSNVKKTIEEVEAVTVEVTTLRTKAQGAGTLGYWLLRAGTVILSGAAGFGAAYTWLTGRPPP